MSHQAAQLPVIFVQSEPRVSHFVLAERLGFRRSRKIRELIERNRAELESYGTLPQRGAPVRGGNGATQTVPEYLLSEHQALLVCVYSQTPAAAAIRKLVIETFVALRHGGAPNAAVTGNAKPATAGMLRHRKQQYAIAYAGLLDIGIDPATFDHSNVVAYARALLAAKDAF